MIINKDDIEDFLSHHGDIGAKPMIEAGVEIDGWRVMGFLGRGGSSEVYCVKDIATGKSAALKMLHKTERRHQERFVREVSFLESSTSASFPRTFGKGSFNGRPYVVLELLEPLPQPKGDGEVA